MINFRRIHANPWPQSHSIAAELDRAVEMAKANVQKRGNCSAGCTKIYEYRGEDKLEISILVTTAHSKRLISSLLKEKRG